MLFGTVDQQLRFLVIKVAIGNECYFGTVDEQLRVLVIKVATWRRMSRIPLRKPRESEIG